MRVSRPWGRWLLAVCALLSAAAGGLPASALAGPTWNTVGGPRIGLGGDQFGAASTVHRDALYAATIEDGLMLVVWRYERSTDAWLPVGRVLNRHIDSTAVAPALNSTVEPDGEVTLYAAWIERSADKRNQVVVARLDESAGNMVRWRPVGDALTLPGVGSASRLQLTGFHGAPWLAITTFPGQSYLARWNGAAWAAERIAVAGPGAAVAATADGVYLADASDSSGQLSLTRFFADGSSISAGVRIGPLNAPGSRAGGQTLVGGMRPLLAWSEDGHVIQVRGVGPAGSALLPLATIGLIGPAQGAMRVMASPVTDGLAVATVTPGPSGGSLLRFFLLGTGGAAQPLGLVHSAVQRGDFGEDTSMVAVPALGLPVITYFNGRRMAVSALQYSG